MSNEEANNVEFIVAKISEIGRPDDAAAARNVLLNIVPYIGGAVATFLSEHGSQMRTENICLVLTALNDAIGRHTNDTDIHLNERQLVELVMRTIKAVEILSDQDLVRALTKAMQYAVTSTDSFADKQFCIRILETLTSHEITILRELYRGDDPYRIEMDKPDGHKRPSEIGSQGSINIILNPLGGQWIADRNDTNSGLPSLLEFFTKRTQLDRERIQIIARMLDAKGLANLEVHLGESYSTVYRWNPAQSGIATTLNLNSGNLAVIRLTPIAASKTETGDKFLRHF